MADDFYTPSTPAVPMYYRKGTILTWNSDTAENTVRIDGAVFTDLPILNGVEALLLQPGAAVGVIDLGTTWAILGRLTIPNTPDAASALDILTPVSAVVFQFPAESTSSASFTDLTTVGPVVTVSIGKRGRCFVTVGCAIQFANSTGGQMGFDIAGPTNVAASGNFTWAVIETTSTGTVGGTINGTARYLITGLAPGDYTFTAKYATIGGGTCSFGGNRTIIVEPF